MRGALCYGSGDGALTLSVPASTRAVGALVEGENVSDAAIDYSLTDRFQTYIITGQRPGSDAGWGAAVAQVEARSIDRRLSRYRPLEVVAEGLVDQASAEQRAQWEGTVRAAESATLQVTVQGWRQRPGARPWAVNELVRCHLPSLRVDAFLLCRAVEFRQDEDGGTRTRLSLVRGDAYRTLPVLETERDWDDVFSDEDLEEEL